ncbi:hypothetical protein [Mesorhizobium mediterraneum]|uniref:hypothetical protein n=1 Tax=Mesorhizobium mediterraneum TaxID=43617 RepID=UPI001786490F|nr:hypothetical protein [Mesorhizobium mediterraneum]
MANEAGDDAIRGRRRMGPADAPGSILTFISAQGSYATLMGAMGGRLCVAWAIENSYTGSSVAFGLLPSIASTKTVTPKICQPFTLTFEDTETVRIEARNKFHEDEGPLSDAADIVSYSGSHKVVARVPLVSLDWGQAIFDTHKIKGVRLGPVPAVETALAGQPATITIGQLKRQLDFKKNFEAALEAQPGESSPTSVLGYVAGMEILGWPWDALYGAWLQERIPETPTRAFEDAISERYGKESLRYSDGNLRTAGRIKFFWIYDLAGRQLTSNTDGPDLTGRRFFEMAAKRDNCLAPGTTAWIDQGLVSLSEDVGPWGCSLIMTLAYNGRDGVVSEYRMETLSGYTLALNHFLTRLEELRETREKIESLESQKPKL